MFAPPSRHPEGGRYRWSVDSAAGIADAPAWLVSKLQGERSNGYKATDTETWRKLVGEGVEEGQRNAAVARLAGLLLRRLDPLVAGELLIGWNLLKCRPPLEPAELRRTIDSIAARELRRRGAA